MNADAPITTNRMISRLNELIDEDMIVIADIGDSLFAATELVTQERTDFLSPAYYTSMGFSIPAALGAQIAKPEDRPLVITGDGAFQMTGMELGSGMEEAIRRMEAGEDPDRIEAEMGDILEEEDPFGGKPLKGGREMAKKHLPPAVDETLYEL